MRTLLPLLLLFSVAARPLPDRDDLPSEPPVMWGRHFVDPFSGEIVGEIGGPDELINESAFFL